MTHISNARAATDTRHRIAIPNSKPRHIKLVGLGTGGARVAAHIASLGLSSVQTITPPLGGAAAHNATLAELAGAEMIFMVACSGDETAWAPVIKQLVRRPADINGISTNVMITGILVQSTNVTGSEIELPVLRAASDMLIVTSDDTYVADMLMMLGA